jgi:thiol-disulfide isomerase/thioredoxin
VDEKTSQHKGTQMTLAINSRIQRTFIALVVALATLPQTSFGQDEAALGKPLAAQVELQKKLSEKIQANAPKEAAVDAAAAALKAAGNANAAKLAVDRAAVAAIGPKPVADNPVEGPAVVKKPEAQKATLHWVNQDTLPGTLRGADDQRIHWSSDVFQEPVSIDYRVLKTIDFVAPESVSLPKEDFRMDLATGDVLFGKLVNLTADEIVLVGQRNGEVHAQRKFVRSMRRLNNPSLIFLGPTGLAGWSTLNAGRKTDEWNANESGHLETTKQRAELFREFDLPNQVEYEISVESVGVPSFLIAFNDQPYQSVRVETWGNELVVVSDEDFEPVMTLPATTRTLSLRLFWNRAERELALFSTEGKMLAKIRGTEAPSMKTGLYLRNKGLSLTVSKLRISNWNGAPPREVRSGEARIHLVDGTIRYGAVQQLSDDASEMLILEEGQDEPVRVAVEQVDGVYLEAVDQPVDLTSDCQLRFFDGGRTHGSLVSMKDNTITLKTAYADQPVTASLSDAMRLEFTNDEVGELASDVLICDGGKLQGTFGGVNSEKQSILWKLVGADAASTLVASSDTRIIRKIDENAEEADDSGYRDLMIMIRGETVPANIEGVDEAFVYAATPFAEMRKIPVSEVIALELKSSGSLAHHGFGDDWKLVNGEEDKIKIEDSSVTFSAPGAIAHGSAMRGDHLKFSVEWPRESFAVLNTYLFTANADNVARGVGLVIMFSGQHVWVRDANGAQAFVANGPVRPLLQGAAELEITTTGGKVVVKVNGNQVYSDTLKRGSRAGNGIRLHLAQMGPVNGKQAGKVVISKFRASRTEDVSLVGFLDEEMRMAALTVPRFRRDSPPTHLLLAQNGDLIRGSLIAMDAEQVTFKSRLSEIRLPRERIGGVIWLRQDDLPEPVTYEAQPMQVVLTSGHSLAISPKGVVDGHIVGDSPAFGPCRVPLPAVKEIRTGKYMGPEEQETSLVAWKLTPAKEPEFIGSGGDLKEMIGEEAPVFATTWLNGKDFDLAEHKGKIVILDFWATWCGPCVLAMPEYLRTFEKFDKDQVVFIGVNQAESSDVVAEFIANEGWKLDVVMDPNQAIARQYQVSGIPHTVIVDKDGKMQWVHVGYSSEAATHMSDAIEDLLAGREVRQQKTDDVAMHKSVGQPASAFNLDTLDGKETFALDDHRGKVVVLDFWATWCGPCVRAMPQYAKIMEQFDEKDVIFIGVNEAEKPDVISQFLDSHEWKLKVLLDRDQAVAKRFGVQAIPHTVIIGPDGKIEWAHVGFHDSTPKAFEKALQELIGKGKGDAVEADAVAAPKEPVAEPAKEVVPQ